MSKKDNFILGILGSIIGAAIGGALYVGIFELGYIASIAGVVMALLAIKGYNLLGGKIDTKALISIIIILLLTICLSNHIGWTIEAHKVLSDGTEGFFYYFSELGHILDLADGWGEYLKDVAVSILLCGAGCFGVLKSLGSGKKEKATA